MRTDLKIRSFFVFKICSIKLKKNYNIPIFSQLKQYNTRFSTFFYKSNLLFLQKSLYFFKKCCNIYMSNYDVFVTKNIGAWEKKPLTKRV